MKTLADLNKHIESLTSVQQGTAEYNKVIENILEIVRDNKDSFKKIEGAGHKAILRQYLKAHMDIITKDSLETAIAAKVIGEGYSNLIKNDDSLYTKANRLDPIMQWVDSNNSHSLKVSLLRIFEAYKTYVRKQAETNYTNTTSVHPVVELTKRIPEHRANTGLIIDELKYDIWVNNTKVDSDGVIKFSEGKTPEGEEIVKEAKLYLHLEPTKVSGTTIEKRIILKEQLGETPNVDTDPEFITQQKVFFSINPDLTIRGIENFIAKNTYLIKSLELRRDYATLMDLVTGFYIEPIIGFVKSLSRDHEFLVLCEDIVRRITGNILKVDHSKLNSWITSQHGYVDAILSITDGQTQPIGLDETTLYLDKNQIIEKYCAGEAGIYNDIVKDSITSNMPVTTIAAQVSIYANEKHGVFALIPFNSDIIWVPIDKHFFGPKAFGDYLRTSHLTKGAVAQATNTKGSLSSAISTIEGSFHPDKVDLG